MAVKPTMLRRIPERMRCCLQPCRQAHHWFSSLLQWSNPPHSTFLPLHALRVWASPGLFCFVLLVVVTLSNASVDETCAVANADSVAGGTGMLPCPSPPEPNIQGIMSLVQSKKKTERKELLSQEDTKPEQKLIQRTTKAGIIAGPDMDKKAYKKHIPSLQSETKKRDANYDVGSAPAPIPGEDVAVAAEGNKQTAVAPHVVGDPTKLVLDTVPMSVSMAGQPNNSEQLTETLPKAVQEAAGHASPRVPKNHSFTVRPTQLAVNMLTVAEKTQKIAILAVTELKKKLWHNVGAQDGGKAVFTVLFLFIAVLFIATLAGAVVHMLPNSNLGVSSGGVYGQLPNERRYNLLSSGWRGRGRAGMAAQSPTVGSRGVGDFAGKGQTSGCPSSMPITSQVPTPGTPSQQYVKSPVNANAKYMIESNDRDSGGLSMHQDTARVHFCPELVVPRSCQCTLVVPSRPQKQGTFDVTDGSGNLVLQIKFGDGQKASGGNRPPASVELLTRAGEPLALCSRAHGSPQLAHNEQPACQLMRPGGESFAMISKDKGDIANRYILTVIDGARLHFSGSFDPHGVSVTDDDGRLLAATDPYSSAVQTSNAPAQYYRLCVAPLMDVGLVLCGLLCIDHLSSRMLSV